MDLIIGYKSDGSLVTKEVLTDEHLFVSYVNEYQIKTVFFQMADQNKQSVKKCLVVCKEANLFVLPPEIYFETYITDNPANGSLKNRNRLLTAPYNLLSKRKTQKVKSFPPFLIFIDNIWQIVPKLNKATNTKLKALLSDGAAYGIFFIIGSVLPYRNLLIQLMQPTTHKDGVVNVIGSEIIINTDELIFYRERGNMEFEIYYPLT